MMGMRERFAMYPRGTSDRCHRRNNATSWIEPYEEKDVEAMTAAARESIADVSPWMPWCHPDYSAREAAAWIRTTREGHSSGAMYEFAIWDASGCYDGG